MRFVLRELYTEGKFSNEVFRGEGTITDDELRLFLSETNERNLYSMVRPLMDEAIFTSPDWRGTIQPDDPDQWFDNYCEVMVHFAIIAEKMGAGEFVIGSEFNSLSDDERWNDVEDCVREVFSGAISYSANWDSPPLPLDYEGLDFYFDIPLDESATVREIADAMKQRLTQLSDSGSNLENTVVHEVGIASVLGIYSTPWVWGESDTYTVSQEAQYKWFAASCIAIQEMGMRGQIWWKLYFHTDFTADYSHDKSGTFYGKFGEEAIKDCHNN